MTLVCLASSLAKENLLVNGMPPSSQPSDKSMANFSQISPNVVQTLAVRGNSTVVRLISVIGCLNKLLCRLARSKELVPWTELGARML